jgi:hypothetical protein
LGRGWDLFGTAHFPWTPFYPEAISYFQVPLLMIGLYFALRAGHRFSREKFGEGPVALRGLAPTAVLITAITGVFLKLFVG